MKLFDYENNTEFDVKFRVASRKARRDLNNARIAHQQRYDAMVEQAQHDLPLAYELQSQDTTPERRKALLSDVDAMRQYGAFTDMVNDLMDYLGIEQFKAAVRTEELTGRQQELVTGPYDSDFWAEQDQEKIGEAVISFRERCNGRRAKN